MSTKPQDVVVILWFCLKGRGQTYGEMGKSLGLSASESHAAVQRLTEAALLEADGRTVQYRALCNFLIHGVPYAFPARMQEVRMGIPTAWAVSLTGNASIEGLPLPPVWPDPKGSVQGVSVKPLYPSVPKAALASQELYDLLALVDTLRIGQGPVRRLAGEEIFKRMTAFASV